MASISRVGFLAIAIVFHLVYVYSIFDIYFVSPVVSGMRLISPPTAPGKKAPADRLVLFVGDGLRADKTFQSFPEPYPESTEDLSPRPLAPFLRSRVLERGTFGVSHTRVPTESRPGHVAMIAGLYEDVSAVMTGWKLNPVNFDSVFNRSRHTWSWGSPDILPMFEKGAVPGRVDAFTYDADFEDFSQDATRLDSWVFNGTKDLFASAASNASLNNALRQDKSIFFLHLLGLDTTGHSYRPFSKEYLNNIKFVDQGVREITELIEDFYGDGRTAFVFTADHGMSDWGSHGDGHPDNTRTPLIAWGSGVSPPSIYPDKIAPGHDELSSDWGLDHIERHDVSQADVNALMAYLVGVEFPANSVGQLPLPYLAADMHEKAEASLRNAEGVVEMYRVKEAQKKSMQLRYTPYRDFSRQGKTADDRMRLVRQLISTGSYTDAIGASSDLFQITLDGLRYLQTYDWLFLRALITAGFLGWMAFALTTVVELHVLHGTCPPSRSMPALIICSASLVSLYASFIVSQSPITYYGYALFPVIFWEEVYARRQSILTGSRILLGDVAPASSLPSLLLHAVVFLGVIVSLAVSYNHREILTALFVVAAFWPLAYGVQFAKRFAAGNLTWSCSCIAMSIFTLLPAMKVENVALITAGGLSMFAIGLLYLILGDYVLDRAAVRTGRDFGTSDIRSKLLMGMQLGLVCLSVIVTRSSALSLQAKLGLPRGNQIVGWMILVVSLLMPLAYSFTQSRHDLHRQMVYFLTFAPTFVILTISYESLFYVAFFTTLVGWIRLEHNIRQHCRESQHGGGSQANEQVIEKSPRQAACTEAFRRLELQDARSALFFFALLQSAFFSTGNIASIAAFSLESVYRLKTVFDPLSQGALLILKLMIPFALVSANLGILNKKIGVAPSALFMVVMAISDVLTLYFFWVVKDEGSWLDIGSTISHYAIASFLCVFLAALEGMSSILIAGMDVGGAVE